MFFFVSIAIALVAIPVALWAERRKKARRAWAQRLADQHGFQLDADTKKPPEQPFDLFGAGSSKKVSFQFWRAGEQDSVFEYEYTTGSGDSRTTHHRTVALIALPFAAPHTKIGPEGFWSGIGRMVGVRDIEVESAEFNDQYRVTSDDERFAVTLLDQQMLAWLLSSQSGRGDIRFELWGSWLLCVSGRLPRSRCSAFWTGPNTSEPRRPTCCRACTRPADSDDRHTRGTPRCRWSRGLGLRRVVQLTCRGPAAGRRCLGGR